MEKVFKFFLPDPSQLCEGDDEDHRRERAVEGGDGWGVVGGGGGNPEEEGGGEQLGRAGDQQVAQLEQMDWTSPSISPSWPYNYCSKIKSCQSGF